MKVLLDIPDQHAASLLDVLQHISYVTVTPLSSTEAELLEGYAKPVKKTPKPGCMRGKIWMADDFNAPMELVDSAFVEYANKMLRAIGGKTWSVDDSDVPVEELERVS